jgi:uncharacterized protein (TIGR00251 family)
VSQSRGEARVPVRVTPRAGRESIDGVREGALRLRVAASPVDGAANAAVVRLIAGAVGVAPSSVRIVRGSRGRNKIIAIEGVEPAVLTARWPGLGV